MLSPSDGTVKTISGFFGGTEITDAIGHVILIGVDCILLYGVMMHYFSQATTRKLAGIFTLVLGITLELGQLFIPSRGASLIDLIAAVVGVGMAELLILRFGDAFTDHWVIRT